MRFALLVRLTGAVWLDRYATSALGAGWAVVQPLVQLGIFLLVFGELLGARLAGLEGRFGQWAYGVYLAAGMVPWQFLAGSFTRLCGAFLDSRGLLTKIALPLAWMPLPALLAEGLASLLLLGLLLAVLASFGALTSSAWWLLAIVPGLGLALYGVGLILAVLCVFLEDIREGVQVGLQLGFWLTPVVYLKEMLPEGGQWLLALNPATWAVEAIHAALVFGQPPHPAHVAGLWALGLGATWLGRWLLKRTETALRDLL